MPRESYPSQRPGTQEKIPDRERDFLLRRADGMRFLILFLFALLAFRLYTLQFLTHERYAKGARKNVEKKVVTDPVRGRFFDRHGRPLVTNEPYYRLVLDRSWGGKGTDGISQTECRESLSKVAGLLQWDATKERKRTELIPAIYRSTVPDQYRSPSGYVILEESLDFPEIVKLEENGADLPGLRIEERETRRYYHGRLASHLLGYTGPISREDYERFRDDGYRLNDWIGRDGLERAFDAELRGKRGESWQRRYANNLVEEEILSKRIAPVPGEDFYLSLDAELQLKSEELLEGKRGGIAAVDPYTGQVLALASSPGFDLNLFRGGIHPRDWEVIRNDPGKPLVDRSTGKGGGGGYPPGSVFKIVTSIAALEEQLIVPETTYGCRGGIPVGRRFKRCHKRSGHGPLGLYTGFAKSCDVYYYHVGELLGPEGIAKYARGLGFGSPTGLPKVLRETGGLVPDPAWKVLHTNIGRWGRVDTLNTAIGQGFLLVSPLQIAMLTAYVANGGTLLQAQLVSHRRAGDGALTWEAEPVVRDSIPVSQSTIEIVREAMRQVVHHPSGTGRRAKIDGLEMAGKTGTAEHYKKDSDAWFCCFAPFESPEIAIAVAIEEGGHGGETAAPIAQAMLELFFKDRLPAL